MSVGSIEIRNVEGNYRETEEIELCIGEQISCHIFLVGESHAESTITVGYLIYSAYISNREIQLESEKQACIRPPNFILSSGTISGFHHVNCVSNIFLCFLKLTIHRRKWMAATLIDFQSTWGSSFQKSFMIRMTFRSKSVNPSHVNRSWCKIGKG